MLYTETQINTEIWCYKEQFADTLYPEDLATEYADSAVPIYYGEIIEAWNQLPAEYCNQFHEVITELPDRIEDLMKTDIFLYYQTLYSSAIAELTSGKILVDDEWKDPEN